MKNVILHMQKKDIISLSKKLILLWAVIFTLTGCGSNAFEFMADKDSYEAKIEEARIALDDQDYEKARSILEGMDLNDPTVAKLLSSAYAGKAGLDAFNLFETIDSLTEEERSGSINMVGRVLGGEDAILTADEIAQKINYFNKAIDSLNRIRTLTDEQKVQLGLFSVNRAALTIADIVLEDKGISQLTLTDDGIRNLYPSAPDFSFLNNPLPGNDKDENGIDDRLDILGTDIVNIHNSVSAILRITGQAEEEENDLANNFNEFENDIDANRDKQITPSELQNYINLIRSR